MRPNLAPTVATTTPVPYARVTGGKLAYHSVGDDMIRRRTRFRDTASAAAATWAHCSGSLGGPPAETVAGYGCRDAARRVGFGLPRVPQHLVRACHNALWPRLLPKLPPRRSQLLVQALPYMSRRARYSDCARSVGPSCCTNTGEAAGCLCSTPTRACRRS
jgi:hypothetical protein